MQNNINNNNNSRVAYGENRSLCDTSMKLSTYNLHMILIMKIICGQFENPRWPQNSKMAAAKISFSPVSPKLYFFLNTPKNIKTKAPQTIVPCKI